MAHAPMRFSWRPEPVWRVRSSSIMSTTGPIAPEPVPPSYRCPGSFTVGDLQVNSTFTGNFSALFKYSPNTNLSIPSVATATTYPQFVMDNNNNAVTMLTLFKGHGGMIPPVLALTTLPSCTAANEGLHVVATTCAGAACTAGMACGSGTQHCELYCNSTPAYVETGR